jgi:hypothetical protein
VVVRHAGASIVDANSKADPIVQCRDNSSLPFHTIVRKYLHECRRRGGSPPDVAKRRQVIGTRFGGPCEVLRDAFLWAFSDLPDPFLSFQASAANSSTKAEAALVLAVLDRLMAKVAGRKCAPEWATDHSYTAKNSPERARWEKNFRSRWNRMTLDQRQRLYRATDLNSAESGAWERIREFVRMRCGRRDLRAGAVRFTSSEIINALPGWRETSSERDIIEGAMQGKPLNPVSLGRWLKERLVDAPINGLVLRSAQGRGNCAQFWITWSVT